MQLKLGNLLPVYFEESRKESSELWGKNIEIKKGELVKVVAPSGSGKTSLIHFLYGTRNDYHGSISYDDFSLEKLDHERLAALRRKNISVVFQDMRLFPERTVFENINIKRQLDPYHAEDAITEMANRLGIGKKLRSKCSTCSYGEQQRTVIIRALMQPFDFLLLDEPFSHLDNNNSELAMSLMLEECHKRNAAIVFADLERIEFFPFTKLFHL